MLTTVLISFTVTHCYFLLHPGSTLLSELWPKLWSVYIQVYILYTVPMLEKYLPVMKFWGNYVSTNDEGEMS